MKYQLVALVLAGIAGVFTWRISPDSLDLAGVVALMAFVSATALRGYLWKERPDRDWYAGRAAAESSKTLAWRYSVGAEPFPVTLSEKDAAELMNRRLGEVRQGVKDVVLLDISNRLGEITVPMHEARLSTLHDRKLLYLSERIADQRDWYASKAIWNRRRARLWTRVTLLLEVVGIAGALLKATNVLEIDLLGVLATLVAAIAAWSEMKQHQTLSSSYNVAAGELSQVLERGRIVKSEADWASFAANAEEAISREHTMWVASRDA